MNGAITCAEFQEHLPELFSPGSGEVAIEPTLEEHLSSCSNCSALVRDLKYIADEARKLLHPEVDEPSDAVWANIQDKLKASPHSEELD